MQYKVIYRNENGYSLSDIVECYYLDEWSRGRWNEQECLVSSLEECRRIYGLDACEHEILEVKEVK